MKFIYSYLAIILLSSCSHKLTIAGIYNSSSEEIVIETSPTIKYNGHSEKYIGIGQDLKNRGIYWKNQGYINCIIISPEDTDSLYYNEIYNKSTTGIYILKPDSGHKIGSLYASKEVEFSEENIEINSLKIYTINDTIVCHNKKDIFEALNYDLSNKSSKNKFKKNKYYKNFKTQLKKGLIITD